MVPESLTVATGVRMRHPVSRAREGSRGGKTVRELRCNQEEDKPWKKAGAEDGLRRRLMEEW